MSFLSKITALLILGLLAAMPAQAELRLAVLDFELNDFTSNPGVAEEVARTASLQGLLEKRLNERENYRAIGVDPSSQTAATQGFGYLWDHPEVAATLGKLSGADYVVIGRVNKPSFLFVHFMARLVEVATGKPVGEFMVEVKGQQNNFTGKGVENLAGQIEARLQTLRS